MCSVQFAPAGQSSQVKLLLSISTSYFLFPKPFDDIFNDPLRRVYVSCRQGVHLIVSCVAKTFTLALLQLIKRNKITELLENIWKSGPCTGISSVEYRSTSMSAMEETDTFTFEILIIPVKSIIGLKENDNP